MNALQTWTCLFLLAFFSGQSRCSACDWLKNHYKLKNRECLRLLENMGGEVSSTKQQFPLPNKLYFEVEKAPAADEVRFLAAATKGIGDLFSDVSYQDKTKSKALDDFLNILATRQLKELDECAETYADKARFSRIERRLKRHFRKLKKHLQKSNYSSESVETIRIAVKHHLRRMDIIAEDARRKQMN